jgi:hypothetical protein
MIDYARTSRRGSHLIPWMDCCRAALKFRTCLKDDELLQINPGIRKRIMHLNPGLGTRQNEEEGADSGVNETVET